MFNEIILQRCLLFLVTAFMTSPMAAEPEDTNYNDKFENFALNGSNSSPSTTENKKLMDSKYKLNETHLLSDVISANNTKAISYFPNEDRIKSVALSAKSSFSEAPPELKKEEKLSDLNLLWEKINDEVEEILNGKEHCWNRKFGCKNKSAFKNSFLSSNKTYTQLCECDSKCRAYGDCCMDLASSFSEPQVENKSDKQFFCGSLDFWHKMSLHGILMVGQCPPSATGSTGELFCLQETSKSSYYFILDVPVTSSRTNLTYRNYYCALCNNDADELVELNFTLRDSCTTQQNASHLTFGKLMREANHTFGLPLWSNFSSNLTAVDGPLAPLNHSCILEVKEFQDVYKFAAMHNSRLCSHPEGACNSFKKSEKSKCLKQVWYCNPKWNVSSDFTKCKMYSLQVIDLTENVLYKNPHCAKCNFVDVFSVNISCRLRSMTDKKPTNIPAFSALFNVKESEKCTNHSEIWNPWRDKCSPIICEDSYIVWWGKKCVKAFHSEETIRVDPFSEVICPRVALNERYYKSFDNGSIYTLRNNKTYREGEYKIFNKSTILICVEREAYYTHNYKTIVVLIISLICLFIHIFLYLYFPCRRTWHGRNLFCLCCSLFLAQLLFLTGTTATSNHGFCIFLSVCLHYFWLVSFCWMNVLSIDVWMTFKSQLNQTSLSKSKRFIIYNIYVWGFPLLIVLVALTLDLTRTLHEYRPRYARHFSRKLCWINNRKGIVIFFLVPVGIIVLMNFVLFIMTSYEIYDQSKKARFAQARSQSIQEEAKATNSSSPVKATTVQAKKKLHQRNKLRFTSYMKLGILQGLTWMAVFASSFVTSPIAGYIFTILNGLQGAAILISFDIKRGVFHSIWKKVIEISNQSKSSATTFSRSNSKKDHSNQEDTQIREEENDDISIIGSDSPHKNELNDKMLKIADSASMNAIPLVSTTSHSYTTCGIASGVGEAGYSDETSKSSDSFQGFFNRKETNKNINLSTRDGHPNIQTVTIECCKDRSTDIEEQNCDPILEVAEPIIKRDDLMKLPCLSLPLDNPSFIWDEKKISTEKNIGEIKRHIGHSLKTFPSKKICSSKKISQQKFLTNTTSDLQEQNTDVIKVLTKEIANLEKMKYQTRELNKVTTDESNNKIP